MALTLNSNLDTAQDERERQPLINLISTSLTSVIPFQGNLFNSLAESESNPGVIYTDSGILASVNIYDNHIVYRYSDTDLISFSENTVYSSGTVRSNTIVEYPSNGLEVIFIQDTGSTRYIRHMLIDEAGTVLSGPTNITSYSESSVVINSVNTTRLANGTFLIVFEYYDVSGETYHIYQITTSDFSSFSSAVEITPSGLTTTNAIGNPFVIQEDGGDVTLLVDYTASEALTNIYSSISTDNGSNYGAASNITGYTDPGNQAYSPTLAINSSNQATLAYYLRVGALHLYDDSQSMCASDCGDQGTPSYIHYDSTNNQLLSVHTNVNVGYKTVCFCSVVDCTDFTVDDCYSNTTSPAIPDLFSDSICACINQQNKGAGQYLCYASNNTIKAAGCIDTLTQTVRSYYFRDVDALAVVRNVDWDTHQEDFDYGDEDYFYDFVTLNGTAVDDVNGRLYCVLQVEGSLGLTYVIMGYFTISEEVDAATGLYTFHEIYYNNLSENYASDPVLFSTFHIDVNANLAFIAWGDGLAAYTGRLLILTLDTGLIVKNYTETNNSGFHYYGAKYLTYYNGHVYASFEYLVDYDQQDRRGMMDIDLATDSIVYVQPSYATVDNYGIYQIVPTGDDRLLVATAGYGVQIYDITTGFWTPYDSDSVQGFTPDGYDNFISVSYDAANERVFAGRYRLQSGYPWILLMFSEAGYFRQGQYALGTYTTNWNFSAINDLTLNLNDYTPSVAYANDELWSYWIQENTDGEQSIVWGREEADINLLNYLTGTVSLNWAIDRPNQLTFSLTQGHLFDPNNLSSSLSVAVAKGRRVDIQLGENVSNVAYYANQGVFFVDDLKLSYKIGDHPKIEITCKDISEIWKNATVTTTAHYEELSPEYVASNILEDFGNLDPANIQFGDNGTWTGSHVITHQWLDETLYNILEEILDHWGYVLFADVDGNITALEVDLSKAIAHYYSDESTMLSYSPDLSYSDYTNQVVVKGESLDFVEVLYPEELVAAYAGTLGWWGCSETKRLYYSDDEQRVCRNIRLYVIDSPTINIFWTEKGGGSISITDEDIEGRWVEITIVAPNLITAFSLAIGVVLAVGASAIGCDGFVSGWCGGVILALSIAISVLSYILGCICNFSCEIYAQPIGQEKQTMNGVANDINHQAEIGMIVKQEITDPLCYSVASCETVAERELEIVQAQRRRISFEKIAHLQDEIGDIIQIVHPYSLQLINIFITNLTRKYTHPGGVGFGGLIDTIEGWRV